MPSRPPIKSPNKLPPPYTNNGGGPGDRKYSPRKDGKESAKQGPCHSFAGARNIRGGQNARNRKLACSRDYLVGREGLGRNISRNRVSRNNSYPFTGRYLRRRTVNARARHGLGRETCGEGGFGYGEHSGPLLGNVIISYYILQFRPLFPRLITLNNNVVT